MTGFETELVYVEQPLANYIHLLRDAESGVVAVVDPGWAAPVIAALDRLQWVPELILLTHHHNDHIGGAAALKDRYGARIIAPFADKHRISHVDEWVSDGESVYIGKAKGEVIAVPGHTLGHVAYYFPDRKALLSGDTLFSLGCGRLFEGTPAQMWQSLSRLATLPDDTQIYCAHEYTQSNGRFALTVEPNNPALQSRMQEVEALRAKNQPTIPSTMGLERATNPFLRPESLEIRAQLGLTAADDVTIFARIRQLKDKF